MKLFDAPTTSLGDLDAEAAATLIASAADIALVIDPSGVIRDLAFSSDELANEGCAKWLGQMWVETVTLDSRAKVEALLREAGTEAPPKTRHINHPSGSGADVPILYSAVKVGTKGQTVAVGRDLRAVSALQQRLVAAQQSMERDYWRLRQVETRFRLLFNSSPEAVLIVDASTQKVVEANPAAATLLGESLKRIVGRSFPEGFDANGTRALQTLLAGVRTAGRAENVQARLESGSREFLVSASMFRQDDATLILVRLAPLQAEAPTSPFLRAKSKIAEILDKAPDGFVVSDPEGRILLVNRAFIDMAQLATEDLARGEPMERWLGRPGVDIKVLMANLRQHGSVRLFATTLRGEYGSTAEVEISAVVVQGNELPYFGFVIRDVGRRLTPTTGGARELPRSADQLTELVGRVSLKDLVQEATDLIERYYIEAALELTKDNRAAAAEMLGLSRQSLYVKLHRYGLGDLGADPDV
ncbi:MAG: transcriptional regulator PpsR [Rhodocyclaceae bacterium]